MTPDETAEGAITRFAARFAERLFQQPAITPHQPISSRVKIDDPKSITDDEYYANVRVDGDTVGWIMYTDKRGVWFEKRYR